MRFRLDCGVVFDIDFSDLSGIRSFGRDLLGFLRVESGEGVIWSCFIVFLGWSG